MPSLPLLYSQVRDLQRPNLSSTISASQESMSSHRNMEEEKGREEKKGAPLLEVKEDGEAKEVILADSKLGDKHGGDGSMSALPVVELNLIGSLRAMEADQPMVIVELSPELEPRMFPCNYCQRKFSNPQALGGHQKAHKWERVLAKRNAMHRHLGYIHAAGVGGAPYHFPPSVASLPLHGSYPGRPLGTQMHSMVLKPYIRMASIAAAGLLYGRHAGWSRPPPFVNCQPTIERLFADELYGATRAPAARFSESAGVPVGGFRWIGGGDGSGGDASGDGGSGDAGGGSGGSHLLVTQEELPEIDLSLKL